MASNYPTDLDELRQYVARDEMIAEDLQTVFDVVVAIETELGVNPSGAAGTIGGRLFGLGNINEQRGGWERLQWESLQANPSLMDRGEEIGFVYTWRSGAMRGQETNWGADTPGAFFALQSPLTSGASSPFREGHPWRAMLIDITEDTAHWVGVDGEGAELGTFSDPSTVGVIIWNLVT